MDAVEGVVGKAADESGAIITDHPFRAKGEWFTNCAVCNLAMAAHTTTIERPPEQQVFDTPKAKPGSAPGLEP